MKRSAALWAGAIGAVVVVIIAALVLGRDPPPDLPPRLPPEAPGPSTTEHEPDEPPSTTRPPARPTSTRAPEPTLPPPHTGSGPALVAQVREVVRRGEGAHDAAAEQAAAQDLARVLTDLAARGDAALADARLLIAPGEPAGVQEVGARVLARIGSAPALEALAELARGDGAGPARLQALRALRSSPLAFARGALLDVALDPRADLEVRSYALDLMRDLVGAEATLHDVATDAGAPAQLRAVALDALLALEPARGRAVLQEIGDDEALRPFLEALRQR